MKFCVSVLYDLSHAEGIRYVS